MHPLIILLIGVVIVIGLIIFLRVNAFLALITAAMVVSLLAPGPIDEKIGRVADAFGSAAGKIGIVIALAAIIGKCLMDSGAADRIVRTFLRLLGEKRAPVALMGSGFVLAVPVFFDTVFYLLVPLARSLWKRTRRNYVLYILAIGMGGAITHTLVPPTPGPLLVAANMNIDFGWMIMVGILIAAPTAIFALGLSFIMNRWIEIPMRPYSGEAEPEPLSDAELPGFLPSILPVILPVILIASNTVTETLADAEHAALLRGNDEVSWVPFASRIVAAEDAEESGPAGVVLQRLPAGIIPVLRQVATSGAVTGEDATRLREALNALLKDRGFYVEDAFAGVLLSDEAKELLARNVDRMHIVEVERRNRLLLEATFPDLVEEHVWETPRRRLARLTALVGNANLALLLSAGIAMGVLVRRRRLSFSRLAKTMETALMSGGVIILITAGGGAFGAMLTEARVGDVITDIVGVGGSAAGLGLLLLGFGVAAVLKIAQGSSTVAMIAASGMLAEMGTSPELLGFHPVYLAAAIGCGSLFLSWMNDSGFWIFARMSNITEVEGLKLWTLTLGLVAVVGLGFTVLFASVLPLV